MAIHSYEEFIRQTDDPDVKSALQKIQQDHKYHAAKIAERIQNLGGQPVDGIGLTGEFMIGMKGLKNKDTLSVLKDAFSGEQRGIQMASEIIKGDLDDESMSMVQSFLQEDQQHLKSLLDLLER